MAVLWVGPSIARGVFADDSILLRSDGHHAGRAGARSLMMNPDTSAPKSGTEAVLVVEDDDDVRAIVVAHLSDLGYRVHAVANGQDAVAVLEGGAPFDLLLTDVVMPGSMTGYDLADKAVVLRPGIKILLASGYAGPPASARNTKHHSAPVIGKPFRKRDLANAVRAVLDGR